MNVVLFGPISWLAADILHTQTYEGNPRIHVPEGELSRDVIWAG